MNINLKTINVDKIINNLLNSKTYDFPLIIQYADFNVLNYFYENRNQFKNTEKFYLYPDSTMLYFYLKYFIDRRFKKIVSTDLQNHLLFKLNESHSRIFLFGDSEKILEKAANNIKRKYNSIDIAGLLSGYNYNTKEVIAKINNNNIDILFVGLGAGRQEKWVYENYNKLEVKVIISIGGWFQYLAENKKRAPHFFRKLHLEWLHKLIREFPRVWKRYFFGVSKFIFRVLTKSIIIRYEQI